jgi:hypothetical protein
MSERTMRELTELGINEGGAPVRRPRPTDDDFARFEARYALTVPEALRQLLRHANGGHPERDSIQAAATRYSVNNFYHVGQSDAPGSMAYAARHWRGVLGPNALPFAGDGGGINSSSTLPTVR